MQNYVNSAAYDNGYVIAGASVSVYLTGTATLATLYSSNSLSGGTKTNPLTTDSNGSYSFYAPNGVYDIQITNPAGLTTTLPAQVLNDPTQVVNVMNAPFFAKGDGVTNDAPATANALAQGYALIPQATYIEGAAVNLGASEGLFGYGPLSILSFTTVAGMTISGSKTSLSNFTLQSATATVLLSNAAAGVSQVSITDMDIVQTAVLAEAIQLNTGSPTQWLISENYIYGDGYSFLINAGATGGGKFIIAQNEIVSNQADAIELNMPGGSFSNVAITGNLLSALLNGSGVTAGFGIGIAACTEISIVGNVITEARNEALHIEDEQRDITFVGNVANNCSVDGARLYMGASGTSNPVIVAGNHFRSRSGNGTVGNGIYRLYTGNGAISRNIITDNHISGFSVGAFLDGPNPTFFDGNVIDNCPIVIKSNGTPNPQQTNRIVGVTLTHGATTFVQTAQGNVVVGKIIADDAAPTALINKTTPNFIGTILEGFAYPILNVAAASASVVAVPIAPLPSTFFGRIRVTSSSLGGSDFREATVLYNGSTLTESNAISSDYGQLSTQAFTIASGHLVYNVYNAGAATTINLHVNFDGTWYQA